MALQGTRPEGAAAGHGGENAAAQWPARAKWRVEAGRQREIFVSRREELLAAHPDKYIAVCAGEVFANHSVMGVAHMVTRAHPGRAAFLYTQGHEKGQLTEEEAAWLEELGVYAWRAYREPTPAEAAQIKRRRAKDAKDKKDTARQREIFETRREELLAAHPSKHIAVCAGEIFVADTTTKLDKIVMRAHPGRPSFQYSPGCASVSVL